MLSLHYLLAALDPIDGGPVLQGEAGKLFGHNLRDLVLLAGMAFILATALFLYAYITRKKRRVSIGPAHSRAIYRAEPEDESDGRRHRKKRRRRDHPEFLPRNPTLQETGGLPPLRPEEPAEPAQQ